MNELNTFYVSLCKGLVGYWVKFFAEDEEVVRKHCLAYFGQLWCSIYDEATFDGKVRNGRWKATVINEDAPVLLSGNHWEWE